jgi:uncharacterized membrane protein YhaH (DUF805 family)
MKNLLSNVIQHINYTNYGHNSFTICYVLIFLPSFGIIARYLSIVLWLICFILLTIIFICKNKTKLFKTKILYLIFVILCSISIFSPIDVKITKRDRDIDQNSGVILPIVIVPGGNRKPIRDLELQGKIPGKDYEPYGISSVVLCYPRYVIVFFI